jgi:Protein of unknown function (DUF2510)
VSYQQSPDRRADTATGGPPGWYVDPDGFQLLRWWDGMKWSPHTQPLPGIRQEPRPPYPDAAGSVSGGHDALQQESAGRHRQQGGPHDGTVYERGLTPSLSPASFPPARLQPDSYQPQEPPGLLGQQPGARQHKKKILIVVVLVVAALGITSRVVYRSGHTGSGCWMQSQDGTVVAQEQVGQTCTDTARLIIAPEDGGTYNNLSGPVSQPGTLICTATPPPGNPNSWKVWAEPDTDGQEALGLCQMLNNAQMTAAGTRAAALLEGSDGQYETPPPSATAIPTATETPTPATTTSAAAATMSAADYQASYQEAYKETTADYRVGQTPAVYDESDSQFCMTTIEKGSLGYPDIPASLVGTSDDPYYAGCMAALRAQQ